MPKKKNETVYGTTSVETCLVHKWWRWWWLCNILCKQNCSIHAISNYISSYFSLVGDFCTTDNVLGKLSSYLYWGLWVFCFPFTLWHGQLASFSTEGKLRLAKHTHLSLCISFTKIDVHGLDKFYSSIWIWAINLDNLPNIAIHIL